MASAPASTSSANRNRNESGGGSSNITTPAMNSHPRANFAQSNGFFSNRPPSATKAYPSTPKFSTAERAALHRQNSNGSEAKASASTNTAGRLVNRRILESPTVGVKKQKPHSPTRAIPFKLNTAERASTRTRNNSGNGRREELAKCFKALPLPPAQPPLPPAIATGVPPKKARPPTTVQPFHLETDRIDAVEKERRKKKEDEAAAERRRLAEFHATAMPDFNRPVFCPVLAAKRATEVENFQLYTVRRAEERREYEERKKKKEDEHKEILLQRDLEKKRLEEEEIRRIRDAAVPRAHPIRHFTPIEIVHDLSNVTVPQTPKFNVDRRLLERPPSRNRMN